MLLYVDDMAIAGHHADSVEWCKRSLARRFKIKDLGPLRRLLGIEVEISPDRLRLHQAPYITEMIENLEKAGYKISESRVPADPEYKGLEPGGRDLPEKLVSEFKRILGKVMYAATSTRPDIAFTVSRLSQQLARPTDSNLSALLRLVGYLKRTRELCLVYKRDGGNLIGYSDSDYAMSSADRRSTLGYLFILAGAPISWKSQKQRSVSTSTAEAEYIALSSGSKEAEWLQTTARALDLDSNLESPFTSDLRCDNKAAISIAEEPRVNARSKHIDIHYHRVRDSIAKNRIRVSHVATDEMLADGLTKPLPFAKHQHFLRLIGMLSEGEC